jgi:hypothetical protein
MDNKATLVGFSRYKGRSYPMRARERIAKILLRDFADAEEVEIDNPSDLKVWFDANDNVKNIEKASTILGTVPRRTNTYHCVSDSCTFFTSDLSELYRHAGSQHDKYHYLELVDDYNEFLAYYKDIVGIEWPRKIYRCSHCNKYVKADDTFDNPNDAIYHHSIEEHYGETHGFKIVTSVDEIRQEVITSLPKLYRCKHGDAYIEDKDVHDAWDHLLTTHRVDFVRVEVREDLSETS